MPFFFEFEKAKSLLNHNFVILFLLVYLLLYAVYSASMRSESSNWLINDLTVKPAAQLINLLDSSAHVKPEAHRLVSEKVHLSVLNGCEGIEAILVLIAGIVAFNAGVFQKLSGILIGSLLLYALNQLRIAVLYFTLMFNLPTFDLLHGLIGPLFIIVAACLYFLYWISNSRTDRHVEQT